MRSRTLAATTLAAACLAAPATAGAAPGQPASGTTVDDARRVTVDFRVNRFLLRDGRLAVRGTAVTRVAGARSTTRTVRERVTAPARIAQAGRRRCTLVSLNLGPLRLDLLGLRVQTSEINLRIRGVRRGRGSGVLGRLLCSLAGTRVNLRPVVARRAVRALNAELPDRGLRAMRAVAVLNPQAVSTQVQQRCEVLFLQLGPLDLNVLGLVIEVFGASRRDPVTIRITALRGGGVLGDLLCGLAGGGLTPGV